MASTNLGRVCLVPAGEYNAATEYEYLDLVYYNGVSYCSLKTQTGVTPINDGVNWQQAYQPLYAEDLEYAVGSPAGTYANLAALISANPDHAKIYITLDDGKWCYYDTVTSAFVAGRVYQAITIADESVTPEKTNFATLRAFETYTGDEVFETFALADYYVADNVGKSVGLATGALYSNSATTLYTASDYIPVIIGMKYFMNHWRVCFYNSSEAYINVYYDNPNPNQIASVTVPAGASFMRLSYLTANKDFLTVFRYTPTEAETTYTMPLLTLDSDQITDALDDAAIPFEKMDFITPYPMESYLPQNVFDTISLADYYLPENNGKHLNSSGSIVTTGSTSEYTVSDFIPVVALAKYLSTCWSIGFYTSGCNFISESYVYDITNWEASNPSSFTVPATAAYIRVSFKFASRDTLTLIRYTPTPSEAWFEMPRLMTSVKASPIKDYKIVNFGDSIFGKTDDNTSVSSIIAFESNTDVENCAFGGTRMTDTSAQYVLDFSITRLVDEIVKASDDVTKWAAQDAAWAAEDNGLSSYFGDRLDRLKAIDFSTIDVVTIAAGTNDLTAAVPLENDLDLFDESYFKGAIRKAVSQLNTAYPNLRVVILAPIYRYWVNESEEWVEDSDTKEYSGLKLTDYVTACIDVGEELKTLVLDSYSQMGINKYNCATFYESDDGVHLIEAGRAKYGKWIARFLMANV